MNDWNRIRKGVTVYGSGNESLGTVEQVSERGVMVGGTLIPLDAISRMDENGVYLTRASLETGASYQQQNQNELRVPVVEEQLNVGKRATEYGEAQIHRTVTEEEQRIPVELRREEVNVQERDIPDRPLSAQEANAAFQEGTLRVPLRAEEAVVQKQAVVTGEVVVNKEVETERQEIADTVRKQHVEVDQNATRERNYQATNYDTTNRDANYNYNAATSYNTTDYDTTNTQSTTGYSQNYEAATQSTGSAASGSYAQQLQQGTDVYGSDDDFIGKVKQVQGQTFLVDRKMQRDVYVPVSAIQNVEGGQVILNLAASEVDDQGWDNPPLMGGSDY